MLPIAHLPLAKKNKILDGYSAFNEGDWTTLTGLLCEDVVWYPMDGGTAISGRDNVIAYLQELQSAPTEAELLGMAIHGDSAITVASTPPTGKEGDHACADKIVFDEESGCIKEVWHCAADTHGHGHAGHPATHSHP
jgi:ketosteroid isomerase-like protein